MLSLIKRLFNDSAIYSMRLFLMDEYDHLNKEIIKKPYDSQESIKKRDEIKYALFGV